METWIDIEHHLTSLSGCELIIDRVGACMCWYLDCIIQIHLKGTNKEELQGFSLEIIEFQEKKKKAFHYRIIHVI